MFLQREYEFTLPRGYMDEKGAVHRRGVMRLATAWDEIEAAKAPGTKENADTMSVFLLSRVVSRIEGVENVTPKVIKDLFPADFAFLQNMYEAINNVEDPVIHIQCPFCNKTFTDTLNFASRE